MAILQHPDPRTIIALIDAVPAGGTIAADCDGTVWRGDIGDDLYRAAEAHPTQFHRHPDAKALDFAAYQAWQEVDYEAACLSVCEVLRAVTPEEAEIALRAAVPSTFAARRYLVDALRGAMARGVQVWLVSASPLLAVEVGAKLIGFQPTGMLGIELSETGYKAPWPIGPGKAAAWRAAGISAVDLAFGDSKWDLPLLESATTGALLINADEDPAADLSAAVVRAH